MECSQICICHHGRRPEIFQGGPSNFSQTLYKAQKFPKFAGKKGFTCKVVLKFAIKSFGDEK